MVLVLLSFIGSMSEIYPAGFYPRSSTVPPKWTDAPGQPTVVQFNGLVYAKSNRHTGGTGKPNEEEASGIRTWKLYTPSTGDNEGFRYYWQHLHNVIPESGAALVYDEDAYSNVSNYFAANSFNGTASQNLFPVSTATTAYRLPAPIQAGGELLSAGGIFGRWQLTYTPSPTMSYISGFNGYASDPPGTPTPSTPPTLPAVTRVINQFIFSPHPVFVGKTYTGYLEKLESTGSWVSDGAGGYNYVVTTPSITQVALTYTVTQQDFINSLEGTNPSPMPTLTYSAYGAEDLWVAWGEVVLTDVSPDANA